MLKLIGIGLTPRHLTQEALEEIKSCRDLYVENYTSFYSEGGLEDLEKTFDRNIFPLSREDVEGKKAGELLDAAKQDEVGVLVYGDPLAATTHQDLLLRAAEQGVKVKVVPGMSVFTVAATASGLQQYKFGRATTIVYWSKDFRPRDFYRVVRENHERGLHSLCLLDIKTEEEKYMKVKEGLELLEEAEKQEEKKGEGLLSGALFVGLAGLGSFKQEVKTGSMRELKKHCFKALPQSIIVTGRLHDLEERFLRKFCGLK